MSVNETLMYALVAGLVALVYGAFLIYKILRQPAGNAKMQEIALAIQQGASAYLSRQYRTIAYVAIVLALILGLAIGWTTAIGFLIGACRGGL